MTAPLLKLNKAMKGNNRAVPSFLSVRIWAHTATQQNAMNQTVILYKKDGFSGTVRITDCEGLTGRELRV